MTKAVKTTNTHTHTHTYARVHVRTRSCGGKLPFYLPSFIRTFHTHTHTHVFIHVHTRTTHSHTPTSPSVVFPFSVYRHHRHRRLCTACSSLPRHTHTHTHTHARHRTEMISQSKRDAPYSEVPQTSTTNAPPTTTGPLEWTGLKPREVSDTVRINEKKFGTRDSCRIRRELDEAYNTTFPVEHKRSSDDNTVLFTNACSARIRTIVFFLTKNGQRPGDFPGTRNNEIQLSKCPENIVAKKYSTTRRVVRAEHGASEANATISGRFVARAVFSQIRRTKPSEGEENPVGFIFKI